MSKIHPAITYELLSSLTNEATLSRGMNYAQQKKVRIDSQNESMLSATAYGTEHYRVALNWESGVLQGTCSCPVGQNGDFCKHQVAAALLWITPQADMDKLPTKKTTSKQDVQNNIVRIWLEAMSAQDLQELVWEIASDDKNIWKKLVSRAQFASHNPLQYKEAINNLIGRPRYLEYYQTRAYAQRVAEVVPLLKSVLPSQPEDAMSLSKIALIKLFSIYERVDDSDGTLGEVMSDIEKVFREAALKEQLDGVHFAKIYLELKLADDWGIVLDVEDYAPVLGDAGLHWLETTVVKQLEIAPPKPKITFLEKLAIYSDEGGDGHKRYVLEALLKALYLLRGDLNAWITYRSKTLEEAYDYLNLANLCIEHQRQHQAINWLERGVQVYPQDPRLLDTLAQAYEHEGFYEDALKLRWKHFNHAPNIEAFKALRSISKQLKSWEDWQSKAIAHVEEIYAKDAQTRISTLIQFYLAEDQYKKAWELAQQGSAHDFIYMELAQYLEKVPTMHAQALTLHEQLLKAELMPSGDSAYQHVLKRLKRMLPLARSVGSETVFWDNIGAMKIQYKARRKFIAMLDELLKKA